MSSSINSRFNCLKPKENENSFRTNRFKSNNNTNKVNSRWQRSKSPEKFNSFTTRGRGRGRGRGRRNFRNNRRGGPSKKFHNVEKDENGRPIISGATNRSFNPFEVALQKKNQKNIVIKKEKQEITKKKEGFEQTKMSEAEKQMILNMQYETDSEQEEDEEDKEDKEEDDM